MKLKHFLFIALVAMLTSCGWSGKKHGVSNPYTKTLDYETVVTKWDTGYREVAGHYDASGKWIPKQFVKDSLRPAKQENVLIKYVDVSPSRESVFKAAKATGWSWQWPLGAVIIVLSISALFYFGPKMRTRGSNVMIVRGAGLGIILGMILIVVNPGNKSGNNSKSIRLDKYQEIIKTDPNLIQFFDSIQSNGKFVN